MLKELINRFLSPSSPPQVQERTVSKDDVEAIVEAKLKEHAVTLEKREPEQPSSPPHQEDYSLTGKQIEYAVSLLDKVKSEYVLAIDPVNLTLKDLNKLIAYNRFKNKGILVNLAKKGVIKKV